MELTNTTKAYILDTAKTLKGSDLRLFKARTVQQLGRGGQRLAERELGWNRKTIRKGTHELRSGITCCDAFRLRGCQPAEQKLASLRQDVQAVLDAQSQTDPQFRSNRLYTRLSAAEVRRQRIAQKGYREAELPALSTLSAKMRLWGYYPRKVKKSQPKKR